MTLTVCQMHNILESCEFDDIDEFRILAAHPSFNIHQNNGEIVQTACLHGSLRILKYILDNMQPFIHAKNEKAFKNACLASHNNLEVAKLLLEKYNSINIHIDDDFIHKEACRLGKLEIVKLLYEQHPNLDLYENFDSGYVLACSNGQFKIVEYLLQIKPELISKYYLESLYGACKSNKIAMVQYLITNVRYDNMELPIDCVKLFELCTEHQDLELCNWFYDNHYFDDIGSDTLKKVFLNNISKPDSAVCIWIMKKYKPDVEQSWYGGSVLTLYDLFYTNKIHLSQSIIEEVCSVYMLHDNLEMCKTIYGRHTTEIDIYKIYKANYFYFLGSLWIIPKTKMPLYYWLSTINTDIKKEFDKDLYKTLKVLLINKEIATLTEYENKFKFCSNSKDKLYKLLCTVCNNFLSLNESCEWISHLMTENDFTDFFAYMIDNSQYNGARYFFEHYKDKIILSDPMLERIIKMIRYKNFDDVFWIYFINPKYSKFIYERVDIRSILRNINVSDETRAVRCIICKIYHDTIIELPCKHVICFDKLMELRAKSNIINKCIACQTEYNLKNCSSYNGKDLYTKIFNR